MATARLPGSGSTNRVASTARPISSTLAIVPTPGRCRSGSHASSTTTPTRIVTVPKLSGVKRVRPSCSTSHGSSPRPERTSRPMVTP